MASLSDKLSIDWMLKGANQAPNLDVSQAAPAAQLNLSPAVEEALIFHGRDILEQLARAADHAALVHDILETFPPDVQLQDLLSLVDHLAARGDIEISKPSRLGNHQIRLTPQGQALIERYGVRD